jgi:dipeptidase
MTPNPQSGPNYSDLSRIPLERAKTAREAAAIVGELINKHGFSTYGGNSHVFADPNEGWVLLNFAGGQGLWVAKRLGPDDIWLNWRGHNDFGYIQEVPLNFKEDPNYMGSHNFISFAVKQGWYDPKSGEPFNVIKVYCRKCEYKEAIHVQDRVRKLAPKVCVKDLMQILRDVGRDSSGYGQVAHLRPNVHTELGILWCAPTSALTAPFIPYRVGVTDVPPEFKRHRYLTDGAAKRSVSASEQGLESTRYANRECKRLYYLVSEHRKEFLPEVDQALGAFEGQLLKEQQTVERIAQKLYDAGEPELARQYLTYYSKTEAGNGLRLVTALAESLEARTKVLYGIRDRDGTRK